MNSLLKTRFSNSTAIGLGIGERHSTVPIIIWGVSALFVGLESTMRHLPFPSRYLSFNIYSVGIGVFINIVL